MIEISQTARMYVFFVTGMLWFAACLFRWERDQRLASLVALLVVWLLSLHFQILAIFAAPLFVYPGVANQSWKQTIQGCIAGFLGAVVFYAYYKWTGSMYLRGAERPPPIESDTATTASDVLTTGTQWPMLVTMSIGIVIAFIVLIVVARRVGGRGAIPALLVILGLLGMLMRQFHAGGLFFIAGAVFWLRDPALSRRMLVAAVAAAAVIAAAHLGLAYQSGLYPGRKLIGALVGIPSVWPVLKFLEYSPVAGAMYGAAALLMLHNFTKGRAMPMHALYFVIGVWVPLLLLGFLAWYIPARYASGQLGIFLLCTFAGLAYILQEMRSTGRERQMQLAATTLAVVLLVNPIVLMRTVNAGYESFPDHKGRSGVY